MVAKGHYDLQAEKGVTSKRSVRLQHVDATVTEIRRGALALAARECHGTLESASWPRQKGILQDLQDSGYAVAESMAQQQAGGLSHAAFKVRCLPELAFKQA